MYEGEDLNSLEDDKSSDDAFEIEIAKAGIRTNAL